MIRWIDPPVAPSTRLFRDLAGKRETILMIYEAFMGHKSGAGLGWAPMLCEIIRRVESSSKPAKKK